MDPGDNCPVDFPYDFDGEDMADEDFSDCCEY